MTAFTQVHWRSVGMYGRLLVAIALRADDCFLVRVFALIHVQNRDNWPVVLTFFVKQIGHWLDGGVRFHAR